MSMRKVRAVHFMWSVKISFSEKGLRGCCVYLIERGQRTPLDGPTSEKLWNES